MPAKVRWTFSKRPTLVWNPGPYTGSDYTVTNTGIENYSNVLNVSQSNPGYENLGNSRERVGGNFRVTRRFYEEGSTLPNGPLHFSTTADPMLPLTGYHAYGYQFARTADINESYFQAVAASSDASLDALGTTAISRIVPTNPAFSAAQTIGELREGLPNLFLPNLKSRIKKARNAGDHYLNLEFGWKPLIRDIRKFAHVVRESEKILEQYHKNSSVLLRRRYDYPTNLNMQTEVHVSQRPVPILSSTVMSSPTGTRTVFITNKTERWLEATFVYYAPPPKGNSFLTKTAEANRLIGLKLTPDVLWNLAPWSWAADWVANTGSIMTNLSAFNQDGLVMPWAYMMERKFSSAEHVLSGIRYKSYPGEHRLTQKFTTVVKSRRGATPYGFGFNLDTLTSKQAAIIGALGLSRAKV